MAEWSADGHSDLKICGRNFGPITRWENPANLPDASRVLFNLSRRETLMMRGRFLFLLSFFFFPRGGRAGGSIGADTASRADGERDVTSLSGFPSSPACLPLSFDTGGEQRSAVFATGALRGEHRKAFSGGGGGGIAFLSPFFLFLSVSCLAAFYFTNERHDKKRDTFVNRGHQQVRVYFFF